MFWRSKVYENFILYRDTFVFGADDFGRRLVGDEASCFTESISVGEQGDAGVWV